MRAGAAAVLGATITLTTTAWIIAGNIKAQNEKIERAIKESTAMKLCESAKGELSKDEQQTCNNLRARILADMQRIDAEHPAP